MRRRRRARESQEKKRQWTEFKEALYCPSVVVQGQYDEKMVCARGVPGATGTLGKANSHFDQTQMGSGTAPPR